MYPQATLRSAAKTLGLCFLLIAGNAAADEPVDIRFDNASEDGIAVEPAGGWPLTLSLRVDKSRVLGFGHVHAMPEFPPDGGKGFLVFADPDGCPSWIEFDSQQEIAEAEAKAGPGDESFYPGCDTAPWPRDETWIEITPGLAVPDPETCGRRPEILTWEPSLYQTASGTNSLRRPIGPCVGSETDGFGYGANPRLPGLVVLSDAGPGVVTTELSQLPTSREARNLAGLFHSVGYELKTSRAETRIVAQMHVPATLFLPVIVYDCDHREDPAGCLVRVDGQEMGVGGGPVVDQQVLTDVVTVRAFIVDDRAPAVLTDRDGNGTVDVEDARKAGFEPLSNEATFRFRQLTLHNAEVHSLDLDGNGLAPTDLIGPPGPGGLVEIPP